MVLTFECEETSATLAALLDIAATGSVSDVKHALRAVCVSVSHFEDGYADMEPADLTENLQATRLEPLRVESVTLEGILQFVNWASEPALRAALTAVCGCAEVVDIPDGPPTLSLEDNQLRRALGAAIW